MVKDELVLMPQYIDFDDPAFYVIKKKKISTWLESGSSKAIVPQKIKLKVQILDKAFKVTKDLRRFVSKEITFI
ncbi:MAG: hypothetical protein Ct9H90mP7_2270 [Candidatus Neomarinimicrobiota bacterium]|nr:MAG: hypothetical protein Ct9H90mP7_2270 [Candidatus Neomarinimicrobiota bacterium]